MEAERSASVAWSLATWMSLLFCRASSMACFRVRVTGVGVAEKDCCCGVVVCARVAAVARTKIDATARMVAVCDGLSAAACKDAARQGFRFRFCRAPPGVNRGAYQCERNVLWSCSPRFCSAESMGCSSCVIRSAGIRWAAFLRLGSRAGSRRADRSNRKQRKTR